MLEATERGLIGPGEPMTRLKALPHRSPLGPFSVVRTIWKQKWFLVLVWLTLSASAIAVVFAMRQTYRSEAVILIESQRIPERFVATTVNVDLQARLNEISQRIFSYEELLKIIQRFDLYREDRKRKVQEEIIEKMRSDIRISAVRDWGAGRRADAPGAFKVSYKGPNPVVVAQVASQLANLFMDENLKARELQAVGTSEFIDTQLADSKRRLDQQEQVLAHYKQRFNGELPQQENALIANLTRLQAQLSSLQDSLNRSEQNRLMLSNALDSAQASEAALTRMMDQLSGLRGEPAGRPPAARNRAELLAEQLEALRRHYTDAHPDVRRLKWELAAAQNSGQRPPEARDGSRDALPAGVSAESPQMAQALLRERERVEALRSQLAAAEHQAPLLNRERAEVLKQLQGVQARIEKLPLREQELASLLRDYEISKANYRSLLDKKLSAEMSAEMERRQKGERFSLIDAPRVPEKPIRPNRGLISAIGCFFGLAVGAAAAFGRESKSNAILGEWELPAGIPVLGRVPRIAVASNGNGGRRAARRRRQRWIAIALVASLICALAAAAAAVWYWLR